MRRRGGLGRGLSALIPGATGEGGLLEVPLEAIAPNPRQPRERWDKEELAGLAQSIREVGVLQPVVVRPRDGGYELVAGERRLRAAEQAGLATIPAIVRETDDTESLREALIENIHRADLGPLELAAALQELLEELGVTHEELASRMGISRPHLTNTLRLLGLPGEIQEMLVAGKIQVGHARALLALPNADAQARLALRIAAEGLSVTHVEELVQTYAGAGRKDGKRKRSRPARDHRLAEVEETLAQELGTRVRVQVGKRKGSIVVDFTSAKDLDRIVSRIVRGG